MGVEFLVLFSTMEGKKMYFINYSTNEAETLPNPTEYAILMIKQRGFVEVSAEEWETYVDSHFND